MNQKKPFKQIIFLHSIKSFFTLYYFINFHINQGHLSIYACIVGYRIEFMRNYNINLCISSPKSIFNLDWSGSPSSRKKKIFSNTISESWISFLKVKIFNPSEWNKSVVRIDSCKTGYWGQSQVKLYKFQLKLMKLEVTRKKLNFTV